MFNIMKEYHQKFNKLKNLKTRTKDNEKRQQEVLTNVGDTYNELYDIYKSKYNEKIDKLSANNNEKFDYKKLRLRDNYLYSSEEEQKEEQEKQDEKTIDANEFNESIIKEETDTNKKLFKKYFYYQTPPVLLKDLYKTNSKLVCVINSGLKELKEEINEMSEKEKEIEKPDKIVEIVEEILKFNKQNQEGQGLKILIPTQLLSRLPITLA